MRNLRFALVLAASLLLAASYSSAALVAEYDFENSSAIYADSSGNGNDATPWGNNFWGNASSGILGGSNAPSQPKHGTGNLFIGFGYFTLPNLTASFAGQTATLSMWVREDVAAPDSSRTGLEQTGDWHMANPGAGIYPTTHYPYPGNLGYFSTFRGADRVNGVALSPSIPADQWHLVTITTSPTDGYKVYQNTTSIYTGTNSSFFLATAPLIGAGLDSSGNVYYYGRFWVDNVRLYNTALSASEVGALFAAPEPATMSLLALGGLGLLRRRK